jgi:hypothetical protein
MVKYTSDEISHLIEVAQSSDTIVLAIRGLWPELIELNLKPALNAECKVWLGDDCQQSGGDFLE